MDINEKWLDSRYIIKESQRDLEWKENRKVKGDFKDFDLKNFKNGVAIHLASAIHWGNVETDIYRGWGWGIVVGDVWGKEENSKFSVELLNWNTY